jgi:hypothetical protein
LGSHPPIPRGTAIMNETIPPRSSETIPLACAIAKSASQLAAFYVKHYKLSPAEAVAKLSEADDAYATRIMEQAPDQLSLCDLHFLGTRDEEAAMRLWDSVKQAARDELASGYRAAEGVEFPSESCWERALFLAVRSELAEQYNPQNGMERMLIDSMAQAQTVGQFWLKQMISRATLERLTVQKLRDLGYSTPPRIDDAKAVDQAADMVDRFNKMFLRNLRALRDLRRNAPAVLVQNAGQVNVGGQQVNVNHG